MLLVQEWLARHRETRCRRSAEGADYLLLPHCTERTTALAAVARLAGGLRRLRSATLTILPSGCCGMAGTYGHEAEHRAMSEQIYGLSWARHVAERPDSGALLADGYSCRSQAKLIDGVRLPHPVQALLIAVRNPTTTESARAGDAPRRR